MRKSLTASVGVVDLMQSLKPRKKGLAKGRNKQVKVGSITLWGVFSSTSL